MLCETTEMVAFRGYTCRMIRKMARPPHPPYNQTLLPCDSHIPDLLPHQLPHSSTPLLSPLSTPPPYPLIFPPTSSVNASCHLLHPGSSLWKNHSIISSALTHLQCVVPCFVCTFVQSAISKVSLILSADALFELEIKGALNCNGES